MRTIQSYENEIARLRAKHTVLFKLEKWKEMATVRDKIGDRWAAIDRLKSKPKP